jgi:glycosyltransferase involved in cell wall biosynthesis
MSSHFEGLSLSNIEGMSVGKPFIASDVDGLHEMTEDAGMLFKHGDYKELADIIIKLTKDRNLYNEVAEKCMNKARQYDISRMVHGYIKVYQDLR